MALSYFFDRILLSTGWAADVLLEVDASGTISALTTDAPGRRDQAQCLAGIALPGMPNLHSHAFQRGLAGAAEIFSGSGDNFWSWRRVMYQLVEKMNPQQLQAIAQQLYLEMLRAGYTAVAEFHYLHHDRGGKPYANIGTMSEAILQAAATTGIGLTHLPVLYLSSGFGESGVLAEQARFGFNSVEEFLHLTRTLQSVTADNPQVTIGIAPHSLRAVPLAALQELIDGFDHFAAGAPIHIHIAEQMREVDDCIAHTGQRPVDYLCQHLPVNQHWCLVHATHINSDELCTLTAAGAVAGLCPTTEANLGDGIFPLPAWRDASGHFGIGSDSNSSVSPIEELRWLEYGQRLQLQQRNVFADQEHPHVGSNLWQQACSGGAQALGRPTGCVAVGKRADIVVIDQEHPSINGHTDDRAIDSLVFSGNDNPVRHVISGGQWLIRDGHHQQEQHIEHNFALAIRELA